MPELGDLLRVHEVPSDPGNDRELERSHIPRPSFYLLRPDGHVGLAGSRLDATAATRYVSERLHLGRAEVQALGVERSPPHVDFTGAHG